MIFKLIDAYIGTLKLLQQIVLICKKKSCYKNDKGKQATEVAVKVCIQGDAVFTSKSTQCSLILKVFLCSPKHTEPPYSSLGLSVLTWTAENKPNMCSAFQNQ